MRYEILDGRRDTSDMRYEILDMRRDTSGEKLEEKTVWKKDNFVANALICIQSIFSCMISISPI